MGGILRPLQTGCRKQAAAGESAANEGEQDGSGQPVAEGKAGQESVDGRGGQGGDEAAIAQDNFRNQHRAEHCFPAPVTPPGSCAGEIAVHGGVLGINALPAEQEIALSVRL